VIWGGIERELFVMLVASLDPNHFEVADTPLLCAFVRACALERRSAETCKFGSSWEECGTLACVILQSRNLRLKPWDWPPCEIIDGFEVPATIEGREPAVALAQRMTAAGLSRFEPDPIAAIAEAEAALRRGS
jgi:hypothetical protein